MEKLPLFTDFAQQLLVQSQEHSDATTLAVCQVAESYVLDRFASIQATYRKTETYPQVICPHQMPISFWLPPKDVNIMEVLQKMGFKVLSYCADPNNPIGVTYWVSIPESEESTKVLDAPPAQKLYLDHLRKIEAIRVELDAARKSIEAEVYSLASITAACICTKFGKGEYTSVLSKQTNTYFIYVQLDDPALRSLSTEKREVFSQVVKQKLEELGVYPKADAKGGDTSSLPVLSAPGWNFPEMTVVFSCKAK